MKKTLIVGSLLASGLLLAKDKETVNRLSYFERQGLETQSPRVHTKGMEKHKRYDKEGVAKNQIREGYRVVSDKQTVNAFIPEGK
jgi:phosphoribosylamine-glycine ligase